MTSTFNLYSIADKLYSYLDFQTKTSKLLFYSSILIGILSPLLFHPTLLAFIALIYIVSKITDKLQYFNSAQFGGFSRYYKLWQKLIKSDQPNDKIMINDDMKTCTLKIRHLNKKYIIILPYVERLLKEPKRMFIQRDNRIIEITHPPGIPLLPNVDIGNEILLMDNITGVIKVLKKVGG